LRVERHDSHPAEVYWRIANSSKRAMEAL
jgi:hypothetical protein